jgi:vacuolar-type H+-ATPase subunit E/Vma4
LPLPDLLEALERSTEEEAQGILSAAGSEAARIRAAARAAAEDRVRRALDADRTGLQESSERRRLTARREATARLLRARAELMDRVLVTARARAATVQGWPEYRAALERDLQQLLAFLDGRPAVLSCAPADVDPLRRSAANTALTIAPSADVPAGLSCSAEDGRLTIDLTLPTRLAQRWPELAIALSPLLEAPG